jgi:hypothetical protein
MKGSSGVTPAASVAVDVLQVQVKHIAKPALVLDGDSNAARKAAVAWRCDASDAEGRVINDHTAFATKRFKHLDFVDFGPHFLVGGPLRHLV